MGAVETWPQSLNTALSILLAGARPARILIVGDNEDAAMLLAEFLTELGHEVRTAHDGPSAIDAAAAFGPTICLVDISMAVMDGYEVAKRLRQLDGLGDSVRLMAVTGYGQEADRHRSTNAGFDVHLVKPPGPRATGQIAAQPIRGARPASVARRSRRRLEPRFARDAAGGIFCGAKESGEIMTGQEIGKKYVALCKEGKNEEILDALFAKDAVSVEALAPPGADRVATGLDAIRAKSKWWVENHVVHKAEVWGPYPHDDRFAVRFVYDITNKPSGKRMSMDEVGLFTVSNGKITREEFFYSGG